MLHYESRKRLSSILQQNLFVLRILRSTQTHSVDLIFFFRRQQCAEGKVGASIPAASKKKRPEKVKKKSTDLQPDLGLQKQDSKCVKFWKTFLEDICKKTTIVLCA